MKTTISKKTKSMLSLVLAVAMVLSLAAFNVSATPADLTVVDGNRVFVDFEDSNLAGFTATLGTIALSNGTTEPAYAGSRSLKISMHTDGWAKVPVEPRNIPGSDFGFEKGKTYYISFWLKSDSTKPYHWQVIPGNGGVGVGIPPYGGSDMNFNYNCTSGKTLNDAGWIKGFTTYTVNGTGTQTYWQFTAALNAGDTIYLDNIEIAEVDGTVKTNDVPDGATVVTKGINGAEMIGTGNFGKKTIDKNQSTVTQDFTVSHYGEASWKIEHTGEKADSWFNMQNFATAVPVDNALYYYSFYAMSPEAGTKVQLVARKGWRAITENVELVPNEWTKISALYTHQEDEIGDAYRHLDQLFVTNADGTPIAYVDDIVVAKLSAEPTKPSITGVEITAKDFDAHTATVELTSPVAMIDDDITDNITKPEGITLNSATLSDDGKKVTLELSDIKESTTYEFAFTDILDGFNRTNSFTAEVSIPSSVISGDVVKTSVDGTTTKYAKNIKKYSNGTTQYALLVASYNANGVLVDIDIDIENVVGHNASGTDFEVTVANGASYKAVTLIWPTGADTVFSSIQVEE